jgi:hypothetical protein
MGEYICIRPKFVQSGLPTLRSILTTSPLGDNFAPGGQSLPLGVNVKMGLWALLLLIFRGPMPRLCLPHPERLWLQLQGVRPPPRNRRSSPFGLRPCVFTHKKVSRVYNTLFLCQSLKCRMTKCRNCRPQNVDISNLPTFLGM